MLFTGSKQTSFFKESVYNKVIPKTHILKTIKKKIDFSFINNEVQTCYAKNKGRRSIPPVLIFKIIFLKEFYKFSYKKVLDEIRLNLTFKYFCDLEVDNLPPNYSTIYKFMNLVGKDSLKNYLVKIQDDLKTININFAL